MSSSNSPTPKLSWAEDLRRAGYTPDDFLKRGNGERHPKHAPSPRTSSRSRERTSRVWLPSDAEMIKIAGHLFAMQRQGILRVWIEGKNVFVGSLDDMSSEPRRVKLSWADARKLASRSNPQYFQNLRRRIESR